MNQKIEELIKSSVPYHKSGKGGMSHDIRMALDAINFHDDVFLGMPKDIDSTTRKRIIESVTLKGKELKNINIKDIVTSDDTEIVLYQERSAICIFDMTQILWGK